MTNDEFKIEIGRRISALRKAKNWTLDDMAKQSSLKLTAISNYERGLRLAGPEEITLMARALGVSRAYLGCLEDDCKHIPSSDSATVGSPPPGDRGAKYAVDLVALITAYSQATDDGRRQILGFARSADGVPLPSDDAGVGNKS